MNLRSHCPREFKMCVCRGFIFPCLEIRSDRGISRKLSVYTEICGIVCIISYQKKEDKQKSTLCHRCRFPFCRNFLCAKRASLSLSLLPTMPSLSLVRAPSSGTNDNSGRLIALRTEVLRPLAMFLLSFILPWLVLSYVLSIAAVHVQILFLCNKPQIWDLQ